MFSALTRCPDRRRLRDLRFRPLFELWSGGERESLDLETPSLNPAQAEIRSIAAGPFDAQGARLSRLWVRSVRGRGDFGIDSIRVLPASGGAVQVDHRGQR